MTALESADYQIARDRIKGNPVIGKMAAGVATVPLAELAHQDGTPRFEFMQHANRAFDRTESQNADNPATSRTRRTCRGTSADRRGGVAERAAIRKKISNCGGYEGCEVGPGPGEEAVEKGGPVLHLLERPRPAGGRGPSRQSPCAGAEGMICRPQPGLVLERSFAYCRCHGPAAGVRT